MSPHRKKGSTTATSAYTGNDVAVTMTLVTVGGAANAISHYVRDSRSTGTI